MMPPHFDSSRMQLELLEKFLIGNLFIRPLILDDSSFSWNENKPRYRLGKLSPQCRTLLNGSKLNPEGTIKNRDHVLPKLRLNAVIYCLDRFHLAAAPWLLHNRECIRRGHESYQRCCNHLQRETLILARCKGLNWREGGHSQSRAGCCYSKGTQGDLL